MLRTLPFTELLDWMAYDRQDPIGSIRGDWQAASICASIMNSLAIQRGAKSQFHVKDFLIEFGEEKVQPVVETRQQQSVAEMKRIAMMYAATQPRKRKR